MWQVFVVQHVRIRSPTCPDPNCWLELFERFGFSKSFCFSIDPTSIPSFLHFTWSGSLQTYDSGRLRPIPSDILEQAAGTDDDTANINQIKSNQIIIVNYQSLRSMKTFATSKESYSLRSFWRHTNWTTDDWMTNHMGDTFRTTSRDDLNYLGENVGSMIYLQCRPITYEHIAHCLNLHIVAWGSVYTETIAIAIQLHGSKQKLFSAVRYFNIF